MKDIMRNIYYGILVMIFILLLILLLATIVAGLVNYPLIFAPVLSIISLYVLGAGIRNIKEDL